jgi:hypothetical protein
MLENIEEAEENGIWYYIIPRGYPLYKATKTYDPTSAGLHLDPNGYYFFGVKDDTPEYIESYEKEYGIIFEFVTTRRYKLLALDKKQTQENLYQNAPKEIKRILEENYGYINGLRNSETNNDHALSEYICRNGYQGYAIKHMPTIFNGSFHPEFMFCDITGINYVTKVTTDTRVNEILAREKEKNISNQLKEQRKNKKLNQNYNHVMHDNDNNVDKHVKPKNLFMGNDNDEMDIEGGSKKCVHKRQKRIRKIRKTMKKKKSIRKTSRMKITKSKRK